jgi:flagellar hook assembly protein FlgD
VLNYTTGVEKNDTTFKKSFPYVQSPWSGSHICACADGMTDKAASATANVNSLGRVYEGSLGIAAPEVVATTSPNPFVDNSTVSYRLDESAQVTISVYDVKGNLVKTLVNKNLKAGSYTQSWNGGNLLKGIYFVKVSKNGVVKQSLRVVKG